VSLVKISDKFWDRTYKIYVTTLLFVIYLPVLSTAYLMRHSVVGQVHLNVVISKAHTDTPHSLKLLLTSDQLVSVAATYATQDKPKTRTSHAFRGIWERCLTNQAPSHSLDARPPGSGLLKVTKRGWKEAVHKFTVLAWNLLVSAMGREIVPIPFSLPNMRIWMERAKDRDRWWALVSRLMNFRVP
jgi:hypothetical protein